MLRRIGYTIFPQARKSISLKASLASGLLIFSATIAIALGILVFVYRIEHTTWQKRQQEAAHNAAQVVDTFMHNVQSFMLLVGSLEQDHLSQNPEVLGSLLHQNEALLELILLDKDGSIYARANQVENPVLSNLFTIPQSTWFVQASQGMPYIGDVQISAGNEPYLILALPLQGQRVVAARLRMDVLWQTVSEIHFGESGQAYVVDQNGLIIAHQDPQVVLARTSIAGQPEMDFLLAATTQPQTSIYLNFTGQRVIGSTSIIPVLETSSSESAIRWVVFTEVSRDESLSNTYLALLTLGSAAIFFGTFLILTMNVMLKRLILRPLDALRSGTERIGSGDLEHRIASRRIDEIGQVANAFDLMAARLQEREQALAQARDQAVEASRFKSRLLANVSHDLRTPLGAILGFADMLKENVYGPLNPQQQTTVERIMANSDRLVVLINSLLDQARIEAGKLEFTYTTFKPAELLSDVETTMRPLARSKGLKMICQLDPKLPATLTSDPQRLHQILTNLIGNAIKFTDQGQVTVRLYPLDSTWAMQVSDTGPGIPPEAQSSIFNPFQQLDSSTTRVRQGVGLGLSIVLQLATLMGGRVELQSTVGQGSAFTVYLPLKLPGEAQHDTTSGIDH
ncbi:MAG: ATP-binding protein [Chloroflexota bacterium]